MLVLHLNKYVKSSTNSEVQCGDSGLLGLSGATYLQSFDL